MKTKGNFLSYIAAEKKQRKEEVKSPNNQNSYNGSKSKNSSARSESAHYQVS
ncbi:hypothetical protein [Adhaeribacter rhizoryzae]|uniref:hypothetical protein n=1 Tax=Adhaeribacter rhizoryzae TaxID=2607907 RepID=UPI00167FDE9C|nr:hypothetical protein [Adhaeribacter rhizoryzae]